jgi:hypothetical protein
MNRRRIVEIFGECRPCRHTAQMLMKYHQTIRECKMKMSLKEGKMDSGKEEDIDTSEEEDEDIDTSEEEEEDNKKTNQAWDGIHQYFYNFSYFFLSFF